MVLKKVGVVGTASSSDVLEGETFTSETEGGEATGTMPNNGSLNNLGLGEFGDTGYYTSGSVDGPNTFIDVNGNREYSEYTQNSDTTYNVNISCSADVNPYILEFYYDSYNLPDASEGDNLSLWQTMFGKNGNYDRAPTSFNLNKGNISYSGTVTVTFTGDSPGGSHIVLTGGGSGQTDQVSYGDSQDTETTLSISEVTNIETVKLYGDYGQYVEDVTITFDLSIDASSSLFVNGVNKQ